MASAIKSIHPLHHKNSNHFFKHNFPPGSLKKTLNHLVLQGATTDDATCASLVRWCGDEKALSDGRRLHAHMCRSGKDRKTFLANLLVQMYGRCGSVEDARHVFDKIWQRNTFSWNFMIAVYAQNGHGAEALVLYRDMQIEGVNPNKFTIFPIISASASLGVLTDCKQIHKFIVACGFQWDVAVRTALVNMYGKCGSVNDARTVFDEMLDKDVILWTAMIGTYAQNGYGKQALQLFREMELEGVKPDRITFLTTLDACVSMASLENGKEVHRRICASQFKSDIVVRNALVNMYGKCGSLKDARAVFDQTHQRDLVSWNAIITAYAQNGHGKEALELFTQAHLGGVKPDRITFLSILEACASLASVQNGRAIHKLIAASGFGSDIALATALVNMYGKCGSVKDARAVFDETNERDVILWTAIIAAYAENGHGKEALELFKQMDLEGIKPDRITFLGTLDACASIASLANGRVIHERIVASGLEFDVAVGNALVNMYGKCGVLKDARAVFDKMQERNEVLWTAMIAAYAENGHGKEAIELYEQMILDGVKPNKITFLTVFNACSHVGLLDAGWQHFMCMTLNFGIVPLEEHFACISGLLGRAGYLNEAEDLIMNMPVQPTAVAWTALLGACRIHGDVDRASHAVECVFELEPKDASPYVLLSNMYAAAGRWDDAGKVRETVEERRL